MNSGVEFSHAVDQLHEPSAIPLLNRTRISASPGSTSRALETGNVSTTTGGCSAKVGPLSLADEAAALRDRIFSSASVTADFSRWSSSTATAWSRIFSRSEEHR